MKIHSIKHKKAFPCVAVLAASVSVMVWSIPYASGQASNPATPPKSYTISPTNVNLFDGSYVESDTDVSIGNLDLVRIYVPKAYDDPLMGSNWANNYYMRVFNWTENFSASTRIVLGADTYEIQGVPQPGVPISQFGLTLAMVSNQYVFTMRNGTVYRFATSTLPATITYPDGSVTTVAYAAGKPKLVTSTRGYALVFDYISGRVSAACGFNLAVSYVNSNTTCASSTLKTTYSYTGSNLTSVTNVMGHASHYSYSSSPSLPGYLTCVTDPGTATCKVTNSYESGRPVISTQTMADDTVWNFNNTCVFGEDPIWCSAGYENPLGGGAMVEYIYAQFPYYYYDNYGIELPYTLAYDGSGKTLAGVTMPEGNYVTVQGVNLRGAPDGSSVSKAKPSSGLQDIKDVWSYPTTCSNPITCNLPDSVTDPKGAVTNYTYDSTHGGVLTAMSPAPTTGSARPLKVYKYVPKYAYIKNSVGTLVPAATPIWLPETERQCQTAAGSSAPVCATGAGVVDTLVTYEYGADGTADNLLLRGKVVTADGVSLRTCYGYDGQGNRIWETSPRAGLASCA